MPPKVSTWRGRGKVLILGLTDVLLNPLCCLVLSEGRNPSLVQYKSEEGGVGG